MFNQQKIYLTLTLSDLDLPMTDLLKQVLVKYKHTEVKVRENISFFFNITLILKLDLRMARMYLYAENGLPSYSISKAIDRTDSHTDGPD